MSSLTLQDTLRDLAFLRVSDIDLGTVLPASKRGSEHEDAFKLSQELVRDGREVVRIQERGLVEKEGVKLDGIRERLEEIVEKVTHGS